MSAPHDKLATLAEKLEFSNALRKQAERELSAERVEHGKTKALVDELQHKLATIDASPPEASAPPALSREEMMTVRANEMVAQHRKVARECKAALDRSRTETKRLVNELIAKERWIPFAERLPMLRACDVVDNAAFLRRILVTNGSNVEVIEFADHQMLEVTAQEMGATHWLDCPKTPAVVNPVKN